MKPQEEAFVVFCEQVSPRLVGALVLQTADPADAEDLAQEAMARAWSRWPEVVTMEHREGWVFRVAFNLATSGHRRRAAGRSATNRLVPVPESRAVPLDDRLVLRAALDGLPDRQRSAVVLRHYTGMSVAESAEALGCAEGTVKSLTSQGLAGLRRALGDDYPSEVADA